MPHPDHVMVLALILAVSRFGYGQNDDTPAIHTQSKQVIVFVQVFHKGWLERSGSTKELNCVIEAKKRFSSLDLSQPYTPADCADSVFRGLTANEFHIFEDGAEQKIQSLTFGFSELGVVDTRDNLGHHYVDSYPSRGTWIFPEERLAGLPNVVEEILPVYRIAYTPPQSPEGFCHRIRVKVDRRDAEVFARSKYCPFQENPSDPLRGTELGKRLDKNMNSGKAGKIRLSSQLSSFRNGMGQNRVNIALEFPWKSFKVHWLDCGDFYTSIGILGFVTDDRGSVINRFTDDSSEESVSYTRCKDGEVRTSSIPLIPSGYQTQFDLPAGEYEVHFVVSDGSKFGKLEVPLSISPDDGQRLVLSSIALCKRYMNASRVTKEAAAAGVAPVYAPLLSKGVRFTPTGNTRFRKGEPMIAYFEIYEPFLADEPATKVQVRLRIVSSQTKEIKADTGLRPTESWVEADITTLHIAENVLFDSLPPGEYTLELQASDSGGRKTEWQAAAFSVEQSLR